MTRARKYRAVGATIAFGHLKATAKKIRRRDGVSIADAVKRAVAWARKREKVANDPLACKCGRHRWRLRNPHCQNPDCIAHHKEKALRARLAYSGSMNNW